MKKPNIRRAAAVLLAIAMFFFILTASIGLPIYIRPVYYAHIDALDLPEISGFSKEEIRQSYDQVLDYLTLPGKPFSVGTMNYSQEGAAHFADCKFLFDLNGTVLLLSSVCLLILLCLRKKLGPYRMGRRSAAFYAGVSAVVLPLVLGGLAALDFNRAFVVFHKLFFPGKDNWLFDYRTDEIIRVLPKTFFMHCAILIAASVLILSAAVLVWEFISARKGAKEAAVKEV